VRVREPSARGSHRGGRCDAHRAVSRSRARQPRPHGHAGVRVQSRHIAGGERLHAESVVARSQSGRLERRFGGVGRGQGCTDGPWERRGGIDPASGGVVRPCRAEALTRQGSDRPSDRRGSGRRRARVRAHPLGSRRGRAPGCGLRSRARGPLLRGGAAATVCSGGWGGPWTVAGSPADRVFLGSCHRARAASLGRSRRPVPGGARAQRRAGDRAGRCGGASHGASDHMAVADRGDSHWPWRPDGSRAERG